MLHFNHIVFFSKNLLFPLAVWLLLAPAVQAQVVKPDTAVQRLFDPPSSIKWARAYRGRLDDVSTVELVLGSDGKACRGYMTYAKSGVRLRLDGTLDSTGLRLKEVDNGGAVTGLLRAGIKNKHLQGEWTNADQTLASRFEADEIGGGPITGAYCGDNKWTNRYITKWNGGRADMVLTRRHNGELTGYLWIENDQKTYELNGEIDIDGNYQLQATVPYDKAAAQLQGSLKNPQATECTWMGSGELRQFKFTLRENLTQGCLEYADFSSSCDAIYPRSKCENCNRWFDDQMKTWMETCKSTFTAAKSVRQPAYRNAQRASAWVDVACWTETIFTGYATFVETWGEHGKVRNFNFDLRTGKEITFDHLFIKSFDAPKWLAEYARKESPKLPVFAADPKYREWLNREGFPFHALRRDGIELSTVFHPDYGRQLILVPYTVLKPYMKKDNPIADLVK